MKDTEAYWKGMEAAESGQSIASNPYWFPGDANAVAWTCGWNDFHSPGVVPTEPED
jgi:hypothetical protein